MTFFRGGAEDQHCSTCPFVLLKLSLGGVQLKGRTPGIEAFLCVWQAEHTGALFTFSLASVLITWCEGKLRATPNFTAKLLEQWGHSEKLTTVPTPNYINSGSHILPRGRNRPYNTKGPNLFRKELTSFVTKWSASLKVLSNSRKAPLESEQKSNMGLINQPSKKSKYD